MIYYIQSEQSKRVKIGYTGGSAEDRLRALQVGSPEPLKVVAAHEGTVQDESTLHALFAAHRLHGEWFEFSDAIREHLEMLEVGNLPDLLRANNLAFWCFDMVVEHPHADDNPPVPGRFDLPHKTNCFAVYCTPTFGGGRGMYAPPSVESVLGVWFGGEQYKPMPVESITYCNTFELKRRWLENSESSFGSRMRRATIVLQSAIKNAQRNGATIECAIERSDSHDNEEWRIKYAATRNSENVKWCLANELREAVSGSIFL